jgi:hypothetical protein
MKGAAKINILNDTVLFYALNEFYIIETKNFKLYRHIINFKLLRQIKGIFSKCDFLKPVIFVGSDRFLLAQKKSSFGTDRMKTCKAF